jgi:CreA protein
LDPQVARYTNMLSLLHLLIVLLAVLLVSHWNAAAVVEGFVASWPVTQSVGRSVVVANFSRAPTAYPPKVQKEAPLSDNKQTVVPSGRPFPLVSPRLPQTLATAALSAVLWMAPTMISMTAAPLPALAAESRVVGSLTGSGLFFKDTLEIEAFEDPKVQGVKLYISNFQIPLAERLSTKNFFNDPSYASVACARGKTVAIASNIAKGPAGEEVFEESKSLLFKTLRVQRIYDEASNTVVYVSFNTRLDKSDDSNKSRFKSSLCAVNLD